MAFRLSSLPAGCKQLTFPAVPGASEIRDVLAQVTQGEVLLISAVTGQGINELVRRASETLLESKNVEPVDTSP